jgi:hypothetical protein
MKATAIGRAMMSEQLLRENHGARGLAFPFENLRPVFEELATATPTHLLKSVTAGLAT